MRSIELESLHVDGRDPWKAQASGLGQIRAGAAQRIGMFLFSDEMYSKIKVLSGGEKSRVALAHTLISEANFLLLDEPTNRFSFISENILIQALQRVCG